MSDDEDLEPYEHKVREETLNKQQKRKQPGGQQSKLQFKAVPKATASDDDDDDDDELGLSSFSFAQHKRLSDPPKESKVTSLLQNDTSKKPKTERVLLRAKYPRGLKPLPEGWDAREYKDVRNGKDGKPYWLYSHAYYGDTKNPADMKRTEAEWREVLKGKGGKAKGTPGSGGTPAGTSSNVGSASASGSAGTRDADGEDAAAAAPKEDDDDDDPLAALLNKKQRKAEEEDEMRERVKEEMRLRMDTGVRVNEGLKKAVLGRK